MNKNFYRIIFNKRRGQLMAVAETSSSQGKGFSGESAASSHTKKCDIASVAVRPVSYAVLCVLGAVLWIMPKPSAFAQVVAYRQAPASQQPTILQTANGVPQVNIQTPSAAGVSRNVYSQFDVQHNGVILNNSRTNVQTQQGGWVQGNPWLATGSARVILNEVNSSAPSYLNGYVEVAGQRAEVVIANPSGISVNGGGFINTSKATLTTGTPLVNGGSLDGYRVQAGNIRIDGKGLDLSTTDYAAVLARAVQVNAGIWAKELKVVTGANQIDASSLAPNTVPITSLTTGTGTVPSFALDVAQLGGMYAGKIHLIGTEQGLGVRSAGTIGATGGDLVLQNNGWLTTTGALQASANLSITTQGNVTNSGLIAAQGNTSITANSFSSSAESVLGAGIKTDGSLANSGGLNVTTTQGLTANGKNLAAGDITLTGSVVDLSGSQTGAKNVSITTPGKLSTAQAIVVASQNINISSDDLNNAGGTLSAGRDADFQTAALNNEGGLIQTGGDLWINTHEKKLTNSHATNYVSTNTALNGKGGIASQGKATLITGELLNDAGYIGSKGALSVTSSNINNTLGGQIQGIDNLTLSVGTGTINNTGGLIRSSITASLNAARVTNSNTLSTNNADLGIEGKNVSISAATLDNDKGAIRADSQLAVASSGAVNNSAGLMSAGNTLSLQDSQSASDRDLAIRNTSGTLIANKTLTVAAGKLSGDGKVLALDALNISLNTDFDNSGQVIANGNASLTTSGDVTNSGKLQAGSTLNITADNIDNTTTGEISGKVTQVNALNTLRNRGLIDGMDTQINAATVNNIGTGRIYGDHLSIAAVHLTNDTETVASITSAGTIAARDRLDLGIRDTLTNREHALIYSVGDMVMGGALDNSRHATGASDTVNNNSATIEAGGNLSLSSATLNNTNDHFSHELRAVKTEDGVREDINSRLYRLFTRTTYMPFQTSSEPAQILANGNIKLDVSRGVNHASHVLAGGSLDVDASKFSNTDVLAKKIIRDVGNTYNLVYVPGSGICTKLLSVNCVHPRDEWRSAPYDSSAESTVTVAQVKPASNTNAQVSARDSTAVSTRISGTGTSNARNGAVSLARLPTSSLYKESSSPTSDYLIEADKRFIDKNAWLGSDYMTKSLSLDPTVTQKRLGDGFYEQKLIREQVAELTGRRFLADYTSDEQEYKALMNSAITFGQKYNLRPGIALTAQQIAQLTSDIVWLVEQTVTLSDGSSQKVLVPQVYVKVQPGDLDGSGALLAGQDVNIRLSGDLTNSGTIAGRKVLSLTAENVNNLGGRIGGNDVSVAARLDLNNIGGNLSAVNSLSATAGRDLTNETTTQSTNTQVGSANFSRTGVDRVAGLYVSGSNGTLIASAGRDLNMVAGMVSNTGSGSTSLTAGNNIHLSTVKTGEQNNITWDADNHVNYGNTQVLGSTITGGGDVSFKARNDITATAANVQASKTLGVQAGNSVNILAGENTTNLDEAHKTSSGGGFTGSATLLTRNTSQTSTAVASNFGGSKVDVVAQKNDIHISGSNVISDNNVNLTAGRNVTIEAAQNTAQQSDYSKQTQTGFLSGGGFGVSYGKRMQSIDGKDTTTTAAASTVGSVGGNVNIKAGEQYKQTGSDVLAPKGDIEITAKTVDIKEARETNKQSTEQKFEQSGLTLALTSGLVSNLEVAQKQQQAASQTKDDRMKALATANQVASVAAAAQNATQIDLSLSLGTSKSESKQTSQSDTARGSTVQGGGSVTIKATGAGQASNLTIQGSDVGGKTVNLEADNKVNLLAAQNTVTQTSTSSNSSSSVGASIGTSGIGVTASASLGKGNGNGTDTTYTNAHIKGSEGVSIKSGSDTNLKGATVEGKQVSAQVGGNLNIESLQDTRTYTETNKQGGGAMMVGVTQSGLASGNINLAKSNINSNYASVSEQSGIKAGDGGFQVDVKGNVDLKGGAITSTQAAIDNNKNTFTKGGVLTTSDIQNQASFEAKSVSVNVGMGSVPGQSASAGMSGVGFGSDSGKASSTTTAGISGIAGDSSKRTGDKEQGIAQIFNKDQVKAEVNAQTAITSEFGKHASKAVGDYAATKLREAEANNDQAGIAAWREGGSARVALHAVVGGLTGGIQGAVGAGSASAAAPVLDALQSGLQEKLTQAGLSPEVAKGIASLSAGASAAGLGAVVSGGSVAGGATAYNSDMNNRQLSLPERQKAQEIAAKSGGKFTTQQVEDAMRNASNTAKGETTASNTVINPSADKALGNNPTDPVASTNFDKGAVFNAGAQGTNGVVQQLPNGGNVDPELAATIKANTGGANSPYQWQDQQVGKVAPVASDPNAGLNKIMPNANGCVTAECAAGVGPVTRPNDAAAAIGVGAIMTGAGAVTGNPALIGSGVNLLGQGIKSTMDNSNDVSLKEAAISGAAGAGGAAVLEAQTVKTLIQQGGKTAVITSTTVGASSNVIGDTVTKVVSGEDVTAAGVLGSAVTGGAGANVLTKNPVIPVIATELLNSVKDKTMKGQDK